MEKCPSSYTPPQCSVFQCMHHSQKDTRFKSFIRRPSQDTSLGFSHLRIIQKEKDRSNWKQENPVTGLTYETLCKRWDGLHKMMSYTYLSPTDTWDWMLATWKAGRKRQGWSHLNTHIAGGKGRTELNSRMHESTFGDKRTSCTCAGAAPDYIKFLIQPRICILANQESNSCNLILWFDIVDFN